MTKQLFREYSSDIDVIYIWQPYRSVIEVNLNSENKRWERLGQLSKVLPYIFTNKNTNIHK